MGKENNVKPLIGGVNLNISGSGTMETLRIHVIL
jgi:hypothetical protein